MRGSGRRGEVRCEWVRCFGERGGGRVVIKMRR